MSKILSPLQVIRTCYLNEYNFPERVSQKINQRLHFIYMQVSMEGNILLYFYIFDDKIFVIFHFNFIFDLCILCLRQAELLTPFSKHPLLSNLCVFACILTKMFSSNCCLKNPICSFLWSLPWSIQIDTIFPFFKLSWCFCHCFYGKSHSTVYYICIVHPYFLY